MCTDRLFYNYLLCPKLLTMKKGEQRNTEYFAQCNLTLKGKGKTIPLQAWAGPESSRRRLRFPDFKIIGT
jgi:hypothetical protein